MAATATAPAPQQTPPPQQPPPSDAALIAALIAAFLLLHTAKAITDRLRAPFGRAGIGPSALKAGVALVLSMPQQPMEGAGPATRWAVSQNEMRRAAFTLASVRRIQRAADEAKAQGEPVIGAIGDAVRAERRFFGQHVAASQARIRATSAVDGLASVHGNILGWEAKDDARCTPGCRRASGCNFRADKPPIVEGHPAFPGMVHGATCFPAGALVQSGHLLAATSRWYRGELVEIVTSSGHDLAVTPNHPVLTAQGWVRAGLLDEGSDVVSTRFSEALLSLVDPDDHEQPALIEDVLSAFGERRGVVAAAMPISAKDFHGDGSGSDVAVVRADRALVDYLDAPESEPCGVEQLSGHCGCRAVPALRSFAELIEGRAVCAAGDPCRGLGGREVMAAPGVVSRLRIARILLGRPLRHHQPVGARLIPALDSVADQGAPDHLPRDPMFFRQPVLAGPGNISLADGLFGKCSLGYAGSVATRMGDDVRGPLVTQGATLGEALPQGLVGDPHFSGDSLVSAVADLIELDRVVKVVRRRGFSGHVYNLETSAGWYLSSNIIVHNCRCIPVPPWPGARLLPFS